MNFLDARGHGFVRVAVAVPPVALASPLANAQAHAQLLEEASRNGAMYAVCPELGLTGYSCGDLFHSAALLDETVEALSRLAERTGRMEMAFTVGMPLVVEGSVFNAAVTLCRGEVIAVAPKTYPPEYREFYELRHFARATEARRRLVTLLGKEVPFGNDILVRFAGVPGFVLHTDVCEDIWVPIPPGTKAALAGATVLANLSASNITVGKAAYREQLVLGSSGRNIAVQLYSAAGQGESTTDLAWDGDGYIAERGMLLARTVRFRQSVLEGEVILADADLGSLLQDRMRQGSFRQNAADNQATFREVMVQGALGKEASPALLSFQRFIEPHPFVPADQADRDDRCWEVFLIQATSLRRRLEHAGAKRVVIGVSGGQDSTLALLVAAHAVDLMKLPRSTIIGITMPGFGTTGRTKDNARNLVEALGATFKEVPITGIAQSVFTAVGHDPAVEDLAFQNVQAVTRKLVELATCWETGGLDLGTSDLSELLLGWTTMFGDHASHYGVNAGVPKTLVTSLIRWSCEHVFSKEPPVQAVLDDILKTPVSPELTRPGAQGEILQRTEDLVGPYELHDFFGYWFVRFGYPPSKIARMALAAFGGRYDIATIKKWLRVFLVRFFANQYKRSCLPDGPKVGLTCVSPRGDWRMPSDATPEAWLADLDRVPDAV
ncbi:MAG: NAD(+) synthase [Candidatus Aenigmarchaeota archaeon]|nr:NAD(+) synthase [Candidatus Aenigmarchaeota archaeon]